ncbi:tetratricopeptide repeat protein [Actinophytocola glycyrrhizae]|uniref:Tetratricopeptide repeat protein n=1 Tax=Actinophytocola glycyrrhizae TaxID=2044873 RepID=A0ABV9S348_9PSEU
MTNALIASMRRAVEAAPDDVELRLHLAELLVGAGKGDDAVTHLGVVLVADPGNRKAHGLMKRAVGGAPRHPEFDWEAAENDLRA